MKDIERQWAELNEDQGALSWPQLDSRQVLQREQDHFGFIVVGSHLDDAEVGTVIDGLNIGLDGQLAPDIKLRVIDISSLDEWRTHALFNFGAACMPQFEICIASRDFRHIVRAIAE